MDLQERRDCDLQTERIKLEDLRIKMESDFERKANETESKEESNKAKS